METEEELERVTADLYRPSRASVGDGFHGWLAMHDLGNDISMTRSHIGPLAIRGNVKKDYDYLLFRVHTAGNGWLRQNGREAALTGGSGVLFAGHDSWEQGYQADVKCLYLQFPRESVALSSVEVAGMAVRPLSADNLGMRLLTGYLDQLHALAPEMFAQQRQDAGQRLLLVASAVTVALNVADLLLSAWWGRAVFDAVGPLLLIGWWEVGPALLGAMNTVQFALARRPESMPDAEPSFDDEMCNPERHGLVEVADDLWSERGLRTTVIGLSTVDRFRPTLGCNGFT